MINTKLFQPKNFIYIGLMSLVFSVFARYVFDMLNNSEGSIE